MSRDEVLNSIEGVMRDVFDMDDLKISFETNAGEIDEWDSLAQINIVVALEKIYKVKFNLEELEVLEKVGDMVDLILRKKV